MTDRTPHDSSQPRTVLHDPLIDGARPDGGGVTPPGTPPPTPRRVSRHDDVADTSARRGKHPALSARILATGLAATGTLGLTAGYAYSAEADPTPSPVDATNGVQATDTLPGGADTAPTQDPQTNNQTGSTQQSSGTPGSTTPSAAPTAPPVVILEVPPVAPATPGDSAGSGWAPAPDPGNQQSSGSN